MPEGLTTYVLNEISTPAMLCSQEELILPHRTVMNEFGCCEREE